MIHRGITYNVDEVAFQDGVILRLDPPSFIDYLLNNGIPYLLMMSFGHHFQCAILNGVFYFGYVRRVNSVPIPIPSPAHIMPGILPNTAVQQKTRIDALVRLRSISHQGPIYGRVTMSASNTATGADFSYVYQNISTTAPDFGDKPFIQSDHRPRQWNFLFSEGQIGSMRMPVFCEIDALATQFNLVQDDSAEFLIELSEIPELEHFNVSEATYTGSGAQTAQDGSNFFFDPAFAGLHTAKSRIEVDFFGLVE